MAFFLLTVKIKSKIFSCFFLWSCEKDLDYVFPLEEKIVVVGEISPQNGVYLQVSKTIPNTDNGVLFEDLIVENASVFLETHSRGTHQIFHSGNGVYTLSNDQNILIADSAYTIIIEHLTGIRERVRIGDTVQTVKSLKLRLYSVDGGYVSYLESQRPLETEAGISEPERSFTNIINGLGIITAINKHEIVFDLPK